MIELLRRLFRGRQTNFPDVERRSEDSRERRLVSEVQDYHKSRLETVLAELSVIARDRRVQNLADSHGGDR